MRSFRIAHSRGLYRGTVVRWWLIRDSRAEPADTTTLWCVDPGFCQQVILRAERHRPPVAGEDTSVVLAVGDRLEVGWTAAVASPAQVVELDTSR